MMMNSNHYRYHRRILPHFLVVLLFFLLLLACSTSAERGAMGGADAAASEECIMDNEGQCHNEDAIPDTEDFFEKEEDDEEDEEEEEGDDEEEEEEEEEEEGDLDPVWYRGRADEIGYFIKCAWDTDEEYTASLVDIHTDETWKNFNEVYHQVMPRERSSLPPKFEKNGFNVPIEIKLGEYGRGVFAKENISKGTLIWKAINTAEFRAGQEYRDFLRALPQPLACDVLVWAYVRMISEDDPSKMMVCADLDEGSFVNHSKKPNMALGVDGRPIGKDEDEELTWYGCDLEFYAMRDIEAGEEIQANYDNFVEVNGWRSLGL